MIKIALVELECHADVLLSFLHLLYDQNDLTVDVYTTNEIWAETQEEITRFERFTFFFKDNTTTLESYMELHVDRINKSNLLVFNTLQDNFSIFNRIHFDVPIWVRVHNSNFYFAAQAKKRNDFSVNGIKLSFKKSIRREMKHKKQFLEKVNRFLFPNRVITDWAIKHFGLNPKQVLQPALPMVFFSGKVSSPEPLKTPFKIAVIGTFDPERRDYPFLVEVMRALLPAIKDPIELALLGAARGSFAEKTISELRGIDPSKLHVISYDNMVEQSEFDRQLAETDVIFAPLKLEIYFHVWAEQYGLSKMTGNINDSVAKGIKILLPKEHGYEQDMEGLMYLYSDKEDCVNNLKQLIDDESNQAATLPTDSIYQLEVQRKNLQTFFAEIMN